MSEAQDNTNLENATAIIERFGGIRPMAAKMGVPVTTVQGWKKRDVIPGNRRAEVIEAAQAHGVDLDGLLDGGAVGGDFNTTLSLAQRDTSPRTEARHAEAVTAARHTAAQDDLIRTIRAAEKRAVKTSTWVSAGLVVMACAVGAVLLWPTAQEVSDTSRRVTMLEGQMGEVREEQAGFKRLMPNNLADSIKNLQQQASDIQGRIAAATVHAEQMAGAFLEGDMSSRLAALERQVGGIAGMGDIGTMIDRLKALQQSAEGQAQLAGSVADLGALVEGMRGRMDQLDSALQAAQSEDGALGQTLEGIAPTDLRAAAMLMGLAQFRSSLNRNAPFEDDLKLLKGLVGEEDVALHAAIDRLAPRAAQGVLSPAGLSDQFKGLAGDIVVSSLRGEDVSIQEKAKARFNEIMQVQKDGELITGTDTQATVARAQKMLDAGDVQGAIAELQSLEGPAAETAQPFVHEALATLNAEQVKDMMTGKVLTRLQASAGTGNSISYTVRSGLEDIIGDISNMNRRVITTPDGSFSVLPPARFVPPQN